MFSSLNDLPDDDWGWQEWDRQVDALLGVDGVKMHDDTCCGCWGWGRDCFFVDSPDLIADVLAHGDQRKPRVQRFGTHTMRGNRRADSLPAHSFFSDEPRLRSKYFATPCTVLDQFDWTQSGRKIGRNCVHRLRQFLHEHSVAPVQTQRCMIRGTPMLRQTFSLPILSWTLHDVGYFGGGGDPTFMVNMPRPRTMRCVIQEKVSLHIKGKQRVLKDARCRQNAKRTDRRQRRRATQRDAAVQTRFDCN